MDRRAWRWWSSISRPPQLSGPPAETAVGLTPLDTCLLSLGTWKYWSNYTIWDLKQFIWTEMSHFPDLVEVVEQAERCSTVLIPINAHHGFSGSCQGVLQVAPPCIIVTVTPSAWLCSHLIWYNHHQTLTNGMKGLLRIGNFARIWFCQATKSARGCFSQNFNRIVQLWWHVLCKFNCLYVPFNSTKDQVNSIFVRKENCLVKNVLSTVNHWI